MIVLDTYVLVWWVDSSSRLSLKARRAIAAAAKEGSVIVSTISILEIVTAVRRGRLVLDRAIGEWMDDVRSLPEICFEPVTVEIASRAGAFDDSTHGDPADRIILATAETLRARLVSADRQLRSSKQVEVVW